MVARTHQVLWAEVRDRLHSNLREDRYSRWIAPLRVRSRVGETLELAVANEFMKEWLERYYVGAIGREVRDVTGGSIALLVVVAPDLFPEVPREQERIFGSDSPTPGATGLMDGDSSGSTASCSSGVAFESGDVAEPSRIPRKASNNGFAPTLESFVVGVSNRLGLNAVSSVLDRPGAVFNPLYLHGPTAVGKTHLLKGLWKALRGRARRGDDVFEKRPRSPHEAPRVKYLTAEEFTNQFVQSLQEGTLKKFRQRFRSLDVLIVDDIHLLARKKKTQEECLYTFNALVDNSRQVILAGHSEPREIEDFSRALSTRFVSGLVVGLKSPDSKTRAGILRTYARRLDCHFDSSILAFVAESVRGNARELLGALKQLKIHADLDGGVLSLGQAKEILAQWIHESQRQITLVRICEVVTSYFGLAGEALVSRSRERRVAFARQIAMYLARRFTSRSLAEIGRHLGDRTYTTVKSGETKIQALLLRNPHFVRELDEIVDLLEG